MTTAFRVSVHGDTQFIVIREHVVGLSGMVNIIHFASCPAGIHHVWGTSHPNGEQRGTRAQLDRDGGDLMDFMALYKINMTFKVLIVDAEHVYSVNVTFLLLKATS